VGGCRGCDLRSACKTRLAPVSLDGLLPDDHRVRLVWSFVERLDLTALLATIKAVDGRPGHPPGGPRILMALASWRGSAAPARLRGSRRRQPQASRGASARCWRGRVPYCPARASFIGNIAHVGADVVDRHIGDGGALGVGDELDVIGRPETTVGHLHDPRLRIGRGGARLLGRWFPGFALRIRSRVLRRFLAARSASLRAGSCCLACSSSVTASAAPTRRSRSSAARRRAALACGWRRRDRYQVACADRANRSLGNPPPTRSGAACSGKKSNSPSSSPDARSGRKTALMPSADFRSAIRTASRRSQSLPRQQPGVAVSSRSPRPAGFMRPDRHALSRKMRLSRRRRSDGAQPKIALPVARARKAISNRLFYCRRLCWRSE
jgi:hypothetical protein